MSDADVRVPLSEALTQSFYDWEQRGRGWQLFDDSVELEPTFVPFPGHFVPFPGHFVPFPGHFVQP